MEMDKSKYKFSTRGRGRGSRNHRGSRSRGFRPRGRSAHRRYHNDIGRGSFHWERSQSPVEGSEEFMDRKIRNTSAIIMRHLLDANDSCLVSTKTNNSTEYGTQIDTVGQNINSSERAKSVKPPAKTKKSSNANLTAEQIYEKIMNHITNLNDGRKKNFIYTHNSSGLNEALTDIQKQNRLEISRILRDMSSLTDRTDSEHNISIVPDIGIKIEELPESVIEELKRSLNIDLLNLNEAIEEPTAISSSCPIRSSLDVTSSSIDNAPINISAEPNAAGCFIQIKRECVDDAADDILSSNQCDVETHRPDSISQNQTCDLINKRCSPENRDFGVELKADEGYDLTHTTLDIKDEAQLNDDSDMLSNSLDTTIVFSNDASNEIVNNPNNRELETADTTNSSGIVSDNWQYDYILQNFENTTFQVLASDRRSKCTEIDKVAHKMELIDRCMQHLATYRGYLTQSILQLSNRTNSSPHNHCVVSQIHNHSSPSNPPTTTFTPPTATTSASLIDADQRVLKRRKTTTDSVDEQTSCVSVDMDNEADIKLENHIQAPIHLRLEQKILCIEKVDENYLLLATDAGNIIYVTLHDSCLKYTLDVTQTPITSMQFVKGLNNFIYLYVGSFDKVLRICDFRGRKILQGSPICDGITCMDYMWGYLFMGCMNGSLIRYSCKKSRVDFQEKKTDRDILVVKAAQEGPRRIVLVGHRNAPIYVRDAMSGLCLRSFSIEAAAPTVYSMIIKGSSLYCGTAKDDILVFSFHEGKLINSIIADRAKGISCLKIKDNHLYVGCYNGSIYIYDLNGIKLIAMLHGPGGSIQCMEVLDTQIVVATLTGKFASLSWTP